MDLTDQIIGGAKTYHNDKKSVKKDEVVRALIPDQVSECAIHLGRQPGEPCSSPGMVATIGAVLSISGNPEQIISAAKNKLDCGTEVCILNKMAGRVGSDAIKREIDAHIKNPGPTDTRLLSNFNIDSTLQQWTNKFADFFPYNFNMLNYTEYSFRRGEVIAEPDTLATVGWRNIYPRHKCCACIINSDKYQGAGKHWMALFADARQPRRWTIEFFNSSGNSPAPEWINWMLKTRDQMTDVINEGRLGATVEIIKVCDIRHQHSRTECGVYSLFYIWARLNGVSFEYFQKHPVQDQLMMEFRQHLFRDPQAIVDSKFNFDQFKQQVRIEWE